jgi:hypothetical protein
VKNIGESKELDHYGHKGVVVSESLGTVLKLVLPSADKVQSDLKKEAVKTYGWSDLSEAEKTNLNEAVDLVNSGHAERVSLDEVNVVDFRSEKLFGLFEKGIGGKVSISIAKSVLSDRDQTLLTLVHETAHKEGGDGEKDHVSTIEDIWAAITKNLRDQIALKE